MIAMRQRSRSTTLCDSAITAELATKRIAKRFVASTIRSCTDKAAEDDSNRG